MRQPDSTRPAKASVRVRIMTALLAAGALSGLGAVLPMSIPLPWSATPALADEEPPPPPPPPDEEIGYTDPEAPPSGGETSAAGDDEQPEGDVAPMNPGEAFVTRFSHSVEEPDGEGQMVRVIDIDGTSASIIDIRRPGEPASGQHIIDEPQRLSVSAGEVGQVFGVALADMGEESPDIFLTATAAYGLHRTGLPPGNTDWMSGMWGPDAGPGSVYRISLDDGYEPRKFTDIKLNGRENTGPALGNIAFDPWHKRLFVSDLETGMIHSIDANNGTDMGYFDHGVSGRPSFFDVASGQPKSLAPVGFDPSTAARIDTCPTDFSTSPECWNLADFRRRIWGLNVRRDANDTVRLYYSVWGSDSYGNPDWAQAGEDRRNAVWSIAITANGLFDTSSIRREFFMPSFWPADAGDKAGNSNPVSDIAFPDCGPQNVMLVVERGALRNLGLGKNEPFSKPYESRVIRYELGNDSIWRAKGRYDVGFHDRSIADGPPKVFAGSAGGAAFGYGLGTDGVFDTSGASQSVWMTGDGLCSADGPCTSMTSGEHEDVSEVHGLQGTPASATTAVDGPPNPDALDDSYMIDTDININADGEIIQTELARNDATKIGDLAIYQVCDAPKPEPVVDEGEEWGTPPLPPLVEPPEDWPVHTLRASHEKWASGGHRVQRSWHRREGSWHDVDRSWHWKRQSYHSRSKTWHWREGSWHSKAQSWHRKGHSMHDKRYSWHFRDRSWHLKQRTYHSKNRTWGNDHIKGRSFHVKNRTWGDHFKGKSYHFKGRTWEGHSKGKSYHVKGRTWSGEHTKGRSYHVKDRTWSGSHVKGRTYHTKGKTWSDGGRPVHVKGRTFHVKGKTWGDGGKPLHVKGRTFHVKGKTWGDDGKPQHVKGRTFHVKGKTWGDDGKPQHVKGRTFHVKGKTWGDDGKPQHVKGRTFHVKGKTWDAGETKPQHSRRQSLIDQGDKPAHVKGKSVHVKGKTFGAGETKPQHSRRQSLIDQGDKPAHVKGKSVHVKGKTFGAGETQPEHNKKASRATQGGETQPQHNKKVSRATQGGETQPQHNKKASRATQGGETQPQHNKKVSRATQGGETQPQHNKKVSRATQGGETQPQHNKKASRAAQGGQQQPDGNAAPAHRKNKSMHEKGTSRFILQ